MAIDYDGGLTCSLGVGGSRPEHRLVSGRARLHLLYRMDDIAWCELTTAVARVNVGLWQVEDAGGKGGATLTFGVADIDAAKAELDRHGVRQDGPIQRDPGDGPPAHLLRSRRQCADVLPGSERSA